MSPKSYISRYGSGEQCLPQPGKITHTKLYAFMFSCDDGLLQNFVDRCLAAPANGMVDYQTFVGGVLVVFFDYPNLISTSQEDGQIPYRECTIMVPLIEICKEPNLSIRFVVWTPYLFVDEGMPLIIGRETYGYPKELGKITLPKNLNTDSFVATTGVFETLSNASVLKKAPLMTLTPTESNQSIASIWDSLLHFGSWFEDAFSNAFSCHHLEIQEKFELSIDFAKLMFSAQLPVVNLKQFRDSLNPEIACYQSITESPLRVDKIHAGGPLWNRHALSIYQCQSHQLLTDLGLKSLTHNLSVLSFWLDMDLSILGGPNVWPKS